MSASSSYLLEQPAASRGCWLVLQAAIGLSSAGAIVLSAFNHWLLWLLWFGLCLHAHLQVRALSGWRRLRLSSPSGMEVTDAADISGTQRFLEWSGVRRFGPLILLQGRAAKRVQSFLLLPAALSPESQRQLQRQLALMKPEPDQSV